MSAFLFIEFIKYVNRAEEKRLNARLAEFDKFNNTTAQMLYDIYISFLA